MGCGGGWKLRAARRMKGVVRPQARPTRRKARVWERRFGGGWCGRGVGVGEVVGVVVILGECAGGGKGKLVVRGLMWLGGWR